jgi:hypothetical protein
MKPSDRDQDIDVSKTTLAIHGDFFQQRCLSEVQQSGWEVLAEEFPISSYRSYGSLDIWAALSRSGKGMNLLIECKKSHPDYRKWIFLSKPGPSSLSFPVAKMRKDSLKLSDPKIDPYKSRQLANLEAAVEPNISTGFIDVEQGRMGIDTYAYGAREIKLDADIKRIVQSYEEANRIRERPPQERIYHGCHQLSLAIKSVMLEELRLMEKHTYIGIPDHKVFIPILVTNAELVSCFVDTTGIDLHTGEIQREDAVRFTQVDELAYHFPLPKESYLYPQDVTGDRHVQFLESASQMEKFKKLFIIVVRSSHLKKFLNDLRSHAVI